MNHARRQHCRRVFRAGRLALMSVLAETLVQPAGLRPVYFLVAPAVLIPIWMILLSEFAARLLDRARTRGAARVVADGQRALLGVRLANDEILIATDQQMLRAGRLVDKRWGLTWSAPYTEITPASDENGKSPHIRLRVRGHVRVLDCREIKGESPSDYQRSLRKALTMILDRRTQPERAEATSSR